MPQHYGSNLTSNSQEVQGVRASEVGVELSQIQGGNTTTTTTTTTTANVGNVLPHFENSDDGDDRNLNGTRGGGGEGGTKNIVYVDKDGKRLTTYVEEINNDTNPLQFGDNESKVIYVQDKKQFNVVRYPDIPDVSLPSGDSIRKEREDDDKFYQDKSYGFEDREYISVYDRPIEKDKTKEGTNLAKKEILKKTESGTLERTVIPDNSEEEVITYYHHRDSVEMEPSEGGYKIPEYTSLYK